MDWMHYTLEQRPTKKSRIKWLLTSPLAAAARPPNSTSTKWAHFCRSIIIYLERPQINYSISTKGLYTELAPGTRMQRMRVGGTASTACRATGTTHRRMPWRNSRNLHQFLDVICLHSIIITYHALTPQFQLMKTLKGSTCHYSCNCLLHDCSISWSILSHVSDANDEPLQHHTKKCPRFRAWALRLHSTLIYWVGIRYISLKC